MKDYNIIPHLVSIINNKWNEHIKTKLKNNGYIGVVPNHGPILKIVSSSDGAITVTELAKSVNRPKPTVTEMLNKLQKLGYITKNRDTIDKRIVYVSVTEAGEMLNLFMADEVESYLEEMLQEFDKSERDTFLALLTKCKN